MKCLICNQNEGECAWWLNYVDFQERGIDRKETFRVKDCFCPSCYVQTIGSGLNDVLFKYWKSLQNPTPTESETTMLKFPIADEYPEGYEWFAYDLDGRSFFYEVKPKLSTVKEIWKVDNSNAWVEGFEFNVTQNVITWKETLRQKPTISDEVQHPKYYTWHPAIECYKVTEHFLGNLAQAIQYIWRCGNPATTKGQSKEERIKDLRKAIKFIEFEIERITNDAT